MIKRFFRYPVFTFLMMLAANLGAASPAQAKDSLVIGITQYPSTLHPVIDSMVAKSYVLGFTRRPITVHNADWELICMLCETLPTLENGLAIREKTPDGKDGIRVTYRLKDGITWGDGKPVTTRDVQFSYDVGRHPLSGVAARELYTRIWKLDIVDDKTFTLHVDRVSFDYNAINDFRLLPAHLEAKAFNDPADYKNQTLFDNDTTNPGLYFGPYRISQAKRGSHLVLVPNDTWYGPKPHFQKITIRVIENTAALEANLLSGAIDMIAGELGLTLDQAIAFDKRHGKNFQITYKAGLIYEHIDLNMDNPILSDKAVRLALIHAIDREAISQQLFEGRQPVAHSSVSPLDWVFWPETPIYDYDPEKARSLLNEAGWIKGANGTRVNGDGKPLRLSIMTTAGNRTRELVQQILQSQWREVGIDVEINNEPARVLFGQTLTQRRFDAMLMYAWMSAPESVPRTTLHSKEIPTAENNFAGQNYTGYKNPKMDQVLEEIELELDRAKRQKMWQDLQKIYVRDLPVIPLYFRANPHIWPKWLTGITPTGHQYPTSLWVEQWQPQP